MNRICKKCGDEIKCLAYYTAYQDRGLEIENPSYYEMSMFETKVYEEAGKWVTN